MGVLGEFFVWGPSFISFLTLFDRGGFNTTPTKNQPPEGGCAEHPPPNCIILAPSNRVIILFLFTPMRLEKGRIASEMQTKGLIWRSNMFRASHKK